MTYRIHNAAKREALSQGYSLHICHVIAQAGVLVFRCGFALSGCLWIYDIYVALDIRMQRSKSIGRNLTNIYTSIACIPCRLVIACTGNSARVVI